MVGMMKRYLPEMREDKLYQYVKDILHAVFKWERRGRVGRNKKAMNCL